MCLQFCFLFTDKTRPISLQSPQSRLGSASSSVEPGLPASHFSLGGGKVIASDHG